jgi:hypothetical protein
MGTMQDGEENQKVRSSTIESVSVLCVCVCVCAGVRTLRRVRFRGWKMGGHLHLQGRRGGRRTGGRGGHGVAASVVRVRVLVLLVVLHRR